MVHDKASNGITTKKNTPRRQRILLYEQNYACSCGVAINGGNYFDAGDKLVCGRCAVRGV